MSMANNWNKLKGMNIQHTITGHPLLNGVLWLVADEDWGEAKGELGRVKWRKSRWRLFIKCDLVGRYASSNSFLRESKFGWLVRVVRMVVRGLVRRVVRGVVRRVVRGVGSVGSPRSGGQFFQLSPPLRGENDSKQSERTLKHRNTQNGSKSTNHKSQTLTFWTR